MKVITREDWDFYFKNGCRELFRWYEFAFYDGLNHDLENEKTTIVVRYNDDETISYFKIEIKDMYDIVTTWHYDNSKYTDEELTEKLNSLGIKFN